MHCFRHLFWLGLVSLVIPHVWRSVEASEPPTTFVDSASAARTNPHRVVALTGATIVIAPGKVIEKGTLLVRDGRVAAVGVGIVPPPEATVRGMSGRLIYPGFIDAYSTLTGEPSLSLLATPPDSRGGRSDGVEGGTHGDSEHDHRVVNPLIAPTVDAYRRAVSDSARHALFRGQGFVARLAVPDAGIIRGTSALIATDDAKGEPTVLASKVALHAHLYVPRSPRRTTYPNSPMGAVALARQTFLDSQWLRAVEAAKPAPADRPGVIDSPTQAETAALMSVAWRETHARLWPYLSAAPLSQPSRSTDSTPLVTTLDQPSVMFDVETEQYLLRAERFAKEFGLKAMFRGGGREYRRAREVAATGRPLILPLAFPAPPRVDAPEAEINAELDDLLHWRLAPENPHRMERAGSRIALTTHGLQSPAEFLPALRKAVRRGWPADSALRALTTTPAELFNVARDLGTLEPGKLASFLIADGDLFTGHGRVLETWVAGQRWELVDDLPRRLVGRWRLELEPAIGKRSALHVRFERDDPSQSSPKAENAEETLRGVIVLEGEKSHLSEQPARSDSRSRDVVLEHLDASRERLGARFDAGPLGMAGAATLSLRWAGNLKTPRLDGALVLPDGRQFEIVGRPDPTLLNGGRTAPAAASTATPTAANATAADATTATTPANPARATLDANAASGPVAGLDAIEVNYPLGAWGRAAPEPPPQLESVVFRGGTVWTCGPGGVLENADVWVSRGRIVAVGQRLSVGPNTVEVPLLGRHLSPGLIDSHSHIATDGGVNETGQALTSQVRVGDFIDANDINLYRQLAGGTTAALILHGSANPIGGQGEVIKFRWGLSAEGLRFTEAPPTVKFALGENVTTGPDILVPRFPQTRMGVEQFHRQALRMARDYGDRWRDWKKRPSGPPPRRDLALECLSETLDGNRWIHCHAYRQDETRALLELLEDFRIRVGCLHHVTDGYLMADAILRHGAMVATFTDWWGFKVEAADAVAHNGAFLHRSGIVTSFHSDDRELGRHLNGEAAKALRHGVMPASEALNMVTIAPAKQLRVDAHVGSLEPGKQADLVIWSGPPLAPGTHCEETWIDGRKYFDRQEDLRRRGEVERLKAMLVQAVLASGEPMLEAGVDYTTDKESWDRMDRACRGETGRGRRQGRGQGQ